MKMAATRSTEMKEQSLLDAARAGDEHAFRHIVEGYHGELHAHCYRMLGSVHDAEDALQDVLLRAWRGLPEFSGRSTLRTWLYRIATNVCLDAIARRSKRVLPADYGPAETRIEVEPGQPLVESVWIEPYPDDMIGLPSGYAAPEARYEQREAVELAFIAALQHLPATQRAVLILREVLGYSAREVAESLDTSIASVNSALQRARKAVDERLPDRTQQATVSSLGDERIAEIVGAYMEAWANGDVHTLAALLAEEAVFSMPPWSSWWHGRETIAAFAEHAKDLCAQAHPVRIRANGQVAIAYYALDPETESWKATAIDVITLAGEHIKEITAFVLPEMFERFGLPSEIEP
jgi:RNA polymerase sigma-70 factor (ECF subfamily)